jgi:hypothetical protein
VLIRKRVCGNNLCVCDNLVHFDDAVDFPDEPEAGEETDGSRQQEEKEHHNERVAKVQECARRIVDLQLGDKIVATIDEQINGRESTREKAAPPPVIVFGTEMEIAEQDCGL